MRERDTQIYKRVKVSLRRLRHHLVFLGRPIFEDFFLFVDFFFVKSTSVQSLMGKAGLSSGSSMSGATGI